MCTNYKQNATLFHSRKLWLRFFVFLSTIHARCVTINRRRKLQSHTTLHCYQNRQPVSDCYKPLLDLLFLTTIKKYFNCNGKVLRSLHLTMTYNNPNLAAWFDNNVELCETLFCDVHCLSFVSQCLYITPNNEWKISWKRLRMSQS